MRAQFSVLPVFFALVLAVSLAASAPVAVAGPDTPPLSPPDTGLRVYHLGHSLVGRDMPVMVEQLAHAAGFETHSHQSQLGWGTSLREHWYPWIEIAGFEAENDHPRFRPAHQAIGSGEYDALILTEMVELRDAIRWHDSPRYLARWVEAARAARPDLRIYLYKSWHNLHHPDGWLERLENDPEQLWERGVREPALTDRDLGPVHVIPVPQVLAVLTRAMQAGEGVEGLQRPEDLFRLNPDGTLDTIHFNHQGEYLVALVHFAALYQRPVTGLPHRLRLADGTLADPPSDAAAALMQRIVWDVVSQIPETGIISAEPS